MSRLASLCLVAALAGCALIDEAPAPAAGEPTVETRAPADEADRPTAPAAHTPAPGATAPEPEARDGTTAEDDVAAVSANRTTRRPPAAEQAPEAVSPAPPSRGWAERAETGAAAEAGDEAATAGPGADKTPVVNAAPASPVDAEAGGEPEPAPVAASSAPSGEAAERSVRSAPAESSSSASPAVPPAASESGPAADRVYTGQVRLIGGRADPALSVIYFVPDGPVPAPESGEIEILTRDKSFAPVVAVAAPGSLLRFPNQDPILHNVFSVSEGNQFDLGLYGPGPGPVAELANPGEVNVFCNVHHEMHAHVLVLETPWYTQADAEGRFSLAGLPQVSGRLHVWHYQAEPWSRAVDADETGPVTIELKVVKPSLPEHLDKRGQSYFRRDRDPYR